VADQMCSLVKISVAHKQVCQTREGWIMHHLSEPDLFLEETLIVMLCNQFQTVVFGVKRLDENLARQVASPWAARHLTQQVKSAFSAAEIGERERAIGRQDGSQGDVVKVVPLRDHLSAGKDVSLS